MAEKAYDISGVQLVLLLFVTRLFTILTFVPKSDVAISGSAALLAILLSGILGLVFFLPFFWFQKKCGENLLDAVFRVGKAYGWVVSVLLWLFCLYVVSYTISHFTFFMTSTFYDDAKPWLFLILLILAAAYGAVLGVEACARLGALAFALVLVVTLLIGCALFSQIDLIYFTNPLRENWKTISQNVFFTATNNTECILFLLLFSRTKEKKKRTVVWWLLSITIMYELLAFLTQAVLGNYSNARLFPLHTLATLARFSDFGRLDLLHAAVWIFCAFLRASIFLYSASVCLRRLFPKLGRGWAVSICALISVAVTAASVQGMLIWKESYHVVVETVPFLIFMALFPILTGLFPRAKKPDGQEGKKV